MCPQSRKRLWNEYTMYTRTSRRWGDGSTGDDAIYFPPSQPSSQTSRNPPLCKLVWHSASEECNKAGGRREVLELKLWYLYIAMCSHDEDAISVKDRISRRISYWNVKTEWNFPGLTLADNKKISHENMYLAIDLQVFAVIAISVKATFDTRYKI